MCGARPTVFTSTCVEGATPSRRFPPPHDICGFSPTHVQFALFADAANVSQDRKLNLLGVFDAPPPDGIDVPLLTASADLPLTTPGVYDHKGCPTSGHRGWHWRAPCLTCTG